MTPFELHEPASIVEAIGLIDAHDPSVRPIAGGTALMLMMKAGVFRPTRLVSLRRLDGGFGRIAPCAGGGLAIGAMTPLAAIERSPIIEPTIDRARRIVAIAPSVREEIRCDRAAVGRRGHANGRRRHSVRMGRPRGGRR